MLLWQERSLLREEAHRTTPPGAAAQYVLTRFYFLRHGRDALLQMSSWRLLLFKHWHASSPSQNLCSAP